jgi:hypothetical protein
VGPGFVAVLAIEWQVIQGSLDGNDFVLVLRGLNE